VSCPPTPSKSLETGPLTATESWTALLRRAPGRENLMTDTFPGPLYPEKDDDEIR
jgi:hypothetical protein